MILRSLVSLLITLQSVSAFAEKMDIETHDIVINKLDGVLKDSDKVDKDNAPIASRLADLYAERARLKALSEGDQNCNNCLKSSEDRIKALGLYDKAFNHLDSENQGNALMQMAHLNQMLGRTKKSISLFEEIIKKRKHYDSVLVAQSHAGLGEIYFRSGQFKKASESFNKALDNKNVPNPYFLKYRLAWSLRNSGKTKEATRTLIALLSTSKEVINAKKSGLDPSFWEDGSRDLAAFMAHDPFNSSDIKKLMSLSPEKVAWSNLFYLGTELDRLGKKQQSLIVWDEYIKNPNISKKERLEIQIRSAQAYFDMNQKTKAVELHQKALNEWKSFDCDDKDTTCSDLKTRLRNFVTLWNKVEGPKPTQQLFQAYVNYLKVFGDDLQMGYWAAGVAKTRENHKGAATLYKECAYLAHKQNNKKILEGSLLEEIQAAEKSKDLNLKEEAYKRYLELNPEGPKKVEMYYQLAQISYDRKDYEKAATQFKAIADNKKTSGSFGVKSADLALDSLAILKDDARIQEWSKDLKKLYPNRKQEYTKVYRQSVLNEVAGTINSKRTAESELAASLASLKALTLANASKDETTAYWKNRCLLAEKTKNLSEVRICAEKIISIKEFSENEKERARELLVWANEMEFRFQAAYNAATQLKSYQSKTSDFQLKLAVLADLSGMDSKADKHYRSFIDKTPSLRKANQIRAKLIAKSKYPWKEINKEIHKLRKTPDILSSILVQAYYKHNNDKELEKVLKTSPADRYPEGKMLKRLIEIKELNKFNNEIARHIITSRNMEKSIKKRLDLLNKAEQAASRASRQKDWTLQILAVTIVAQQNARTYRDLISLKTPKGLNSQQQIQYKALLNQRAKSFQDKSDLAAKTLEGLWAQEASWDQFEKELQFANRAARSVIYKELQELRSRANSHYKARISKVLAEKIDVPSQKELTTAYAEAKKDPFDWKLVKKIHDLEVQYERDTLVGYLESRVNELKKGAY